MTGMNGRPPVPPGYAPHGSVDLKLDRGYAMAVQVLFGIVVLCAIAGALWLVPGLRSGWNPWLNIAVILASVFAYMVVHEATHGVLLRVLTGHSPSYSFRFPFLTTGNHAPLSRPRAIAVALGPFVLWSTVLGTLFAHVPPDGRMAVYVLLALNLAGSTGDFVEAAVVARLPRGALVRDDGDSVDSFIPAVADPASQQ